MTACDEVGGFPQVVDPPPAALLPREVPAATAEELRLAFRRHAAGVAVVTLSGPDGPVGFTATSLASVSTAPPLLSFNISRTSSSYPALSLARHIGVHVLTADQAELAQRFATSGIDRFAEPTSWRPGPRRVPLLDGVSAWLVASVEERLTVGDHDIVVAHVVHAGLADQVPEPLVHHDGEWATTVPAAARQGRRRFRGRRPA
jgi:flavin reductase (DIM6/NTAB) family NADH-FMN oxidoreductase RutF